MHTAQVAAWGEAPKYMDAPAPAIPASDSNDVQVKLLATGINQFVRSRASGKHFTSGKPPHTPGADGVGIILSLPANPISHKPLAIGQTVYFLTFQTGGSFSEILNVPASDMVPVPEGTDPIQIAALINPALSSWLAIRTRTFNLPKDFTVLILGATSASGSLAIPLTRHLGAGKVIGAARNAEKLATAGLDKEIVLASKTEETDWSATGLGHVDVILDYINGPTTTALLTYLGSLKLREPVQYVHIGSLSGITTIEIPGHLLRSYDLTVRGSGPGSWSMKALKMELAEMVKAVSAVKDFGKIDIRSLKDVETVWTEPEGARKRIVFEPEK